MAADYPANLWIRDPVLEGRKLRGGGLNRAMELLGQCRDEVTAVETALGTDPAGSATNLLSRLAIRHARSGLPRGRVQAVVDPNAGWFNVAGLNVQIGISGALSTEDATITFASGYTIAPSMILVRYVMHATDKLLGETQLKPGSVTTTDFHTLTRNFSSTDVWGSPSITKRYHVIYMAIGGS